MEVVIYNTIHIILILLTKIIIMKITWMLRRLET